MQRERLQRVIEELRNQQEAMQLSLDSKTISNTSWYTQATSVAKGWVPSQMRKIFGI
jgi:hypothetical protein